MILGIDATNVRGGGGVTYVMEVLNNLREEDIPFSKVVIWGNEALKRQLTANEKIEYVLTPQIDQGFLKSSLWKAFAFPKLIQQHKIDLIFAPGGVFYSKSYPYVSMSQNMLVFDKVERNRFKWNSFMRLKLIMINFFQTRSFLNAKGIIFISEYARDFIKAKINYTCDHTLIRHGIAERFNQVPKLQQPIEAYSFSNPYKLLYISIIDAYKHHVPLIEAVNELRKKGIPLTLELVGPAYGPAFKRFEAALAQLTGSEEFIHYHGSVDYQKIETFYKEADLFVYTSSCENMPNIVVEAMNAGLPIVSSNYAPMPEYLQAGAIYVDPLDASDVERGLQLAIENPDLRQKNAQLSYESSGQYNWPKCAKETINYLYKIATKK